MEVSIYQLAGQAFSKAFPKLLETIAARDMKVLVHCKDADNVKQCDMLLWSFEQLSFLPHQMKGDSYIAPQAIYITDQLHDNPHAGSVVAFYNADAAIEPSGFSRIVYMLSSEEAYLAPALLNKFQQKNIPCSLLTQQANGGWLKQQ